MGPEIVHAEAAQQEGDAVGLATYKVVRYAAICLPSTYRNLILSRWKRSLKNGNDYFKLVEPRAYHRSYDLYISRVMASPAAAIRLAVLDEDSDVVLGFSVCRGSVLDYVHVHKDNRRLGIARNLVPSGIDTITHLTRTGMTIWGSKCPGWTFNPFA